MIEKGLINEAKELYKFKNKELLIDWLYRII